MTGAIAEPPVGVTDGTETVKEPDVVFVYVFNDQVIKVVEPDISELIPLVAIART